ncbi:MAG: DUF2442 domain-containing protein [Spiroplasmataceae bacterium]|nr:DUF2442 domain-containing protein [Spiroplasmataceae bacterium]
MATLRTNKAEPKQPVVFSKSKVINEEKTQILNLAVHLEKLTAELNDGRELSIPINWFELWGVKGITADKLRNYEIKRGVNIYFPDIDEVLGMETFIHGFNAPCE